jgi:hypothetical protein
MNTIQLLGFHKAKVSCELARPNIRFARFESFQHGDLSAIFTAELYLLPPELFARQRHVDDLLALVLDHGFARDTTAGARSPALIRTSACIPTHNGPNMRWIEEHTEEYPGQWVALSDG